MGLLNGGAELRSAWTAEAAVPTQSLDGRDAGRSTNLVGLAELTVG